jgi:D-methionine transport system ATP-binding protein
LTYRPILYEAVKPTSVRFASLQGTVSRMKETPFGQLVVEMIGDDAEVDRVVAFLRSEGLNVEEMS